MHLSIIYQTIRPKKWQAVRILLQGVTIIDYVDFDANVWTLAVATEPASSPTLHFYPLNTASPTKHLALGGGEHIKIGRKTNARTVPGEANGFFDSKVLSRAHAEVWAEGGAIYLRDTGSSNGTYVNGERLSAEAEHSGAIVLKTDDVVEFGYDVSHEGEVLHPKMIGRVQCEHAQPPAARL